LAYFILILLRLKCKMKCLPWWVTTAFFIFIALFIICHSVTRSCHNMFPRIAIIFVFCLLICLIMFFNTIILRKQVIKVLTNFFERSKTC
jgi:glucan phosphoethanolaminetransferase (alkaline phosphatase superfamily)